MFKVTLKTGGKKYIKSGKTIDGALSNMNLGWEQIKAKGILTVYQGNKSHEHLFNIMRLRRIFSNKLVRTAWARNLEYLLKEGKQTNIPEKV